MIDLFPGDAEAAKREAEKLERERRAAEQRLRDHEADFTSHEIVRRQLAAGWLCKGEHPAPRRYPGRGGFNYRGTVLGSLGKGETLHALDIGAGPGVWSAELLRLAAIHGFDVHITAVEIRPEERPWLERVAHEVVIGHWLEAFAGGRTYDVVLGNPPFTEARAPVRPGLDPKKKPPASLVDEQMHELIAAGRPDNRHTRVLAEALAKYDPHESMVAHALRAAPAVFLYMSQQSWTKTASGFVVRRTYNPAAIYDVPGSVSHREGKAADSISYSSSLWLRDHSGPAQTFMLEPFADRSWKIRPGTEPDAWCDEQGIPLLVRGVA